MRSRRGSSSHYLDNAPRGRATGKKKGESERNKDSSQVMEVALFYGGGDGRYWWACTAEEAEGATATALSDR